MGAERVQMKPRQEMRNLKIQPDQEKDMKIWQDRQKFYGQGKRCAPEGIIQLPGGIGRSHSDVMLGGPKSWFQDIERQKEASRASRPEILRAEAQGNASVCPRVPSLAEPLHPPPEYGWQHWLTEKPVNHPQLQGGKTQGVQLAVYDAFNSDQYDPSKHGWAHPEARKKQEELRGNVGCRSQCTAGEPSWSWSLIKAKDHIGYHNANMARGNIQGTAMSMNVPDWFAGVRMVPGPQGYGHRFPAVDCEDGKLLLNTRVWEKGPNLSVIEKRRRPYSAPSHSTPHPDSIAASYGPGKKDRPGTAPSKGRTSKEKARSKENRPNSAPSGRQKPEKPEYFDHWRGNYERRIQNDIRCKHGSSTCDMHPCHPHWGNRTKSGLQGTGCVVKQQNAPFSDWVGIDPKVPGAG